MAVLSYIWGSNTLFKRTDDNCKSSIHFCSKRRTTVEIYNVLLKSLNLLEFN